MKNLVNFDTPWEQIDTCDDSLEDPSHEKRKLEEIRRISNIMQALENVSVQSEGSPDFAPMRVSIQDLLAFTKQRLMQSIHQA